MICYQTDADGYFLYPLMATLDPEETRLQEKDVWTLPAGCTAKKPPKEKEGFRLRYVDEKWVYEEIPVLEPEPEVVPVEVEPLTAVEKLALFLKSNPDVKALLD